MRSIRFGISLLLLVVAGCGGGGDDGNGSQCNLGSAGCACSPEGLCLPGLVCMNQTCVLSATGTGGVPPGTGGASGAGGTPPGTGGSLPGTGGSGGAPMLPASCDACTQNQVCVGGQCVDIPAQCPCPKETYCDLSTTVCVRGCTSDEHCDVNRICYSEERRCEFGCRSDAQCAAGFICEGLQCIPGCRDDFGCPAGQICDGTVCRDGCRDDNGCPFGLLCDATYCRMGCVQDFDCTTPGQVCNTVARLCVDGCRDNSMCGADFYCDTLASICVSGCQPAFTEELDDPSRCLPGQACVGANCTFTRWDNTRPVYTCDSYHCSADCPILDGTNDYARTVQACADNGAIQWDCRQYDFTPPKCMQQCNVDADCPAGRICQRSMEYGIGDPSVKHCYLPCQSSGCSYAEDYAIEETCVCNTTSGKCVESATDDTECRMNGAN